MTTTIDFLETALAREHKQRDVASCLPGATLATPAPAIVEHILRIQARIDLIDALLIEAQAAGASAKADRDAVLTIRVEEEPIAPPHPGGERGAAFSKALRRGITPRGPHTGVQHTGLPEAGGRPPGDYCTACASRWCVCPDRQR